MTEPPEQALVPLYQAITIHGSDSLSFAGQMMSPQQVQRPSAPQMPVPTHPLVNLMQNLLYQYAYTRQYRGSIPRPTPLSTDSVEDLIEQLSRANTSEAYWDEDWYIHDVTASGDVTAIKHGLTRQVLPGEYLNLDGLGSSPRIGAQIRLFFSRESTTAQPGFYFTFGETTEQRFSSHSVLRFYWNITVEGIVSLVYAVTSTLNRFQIPFRFKCLTNPSLYDERMDAAVLFVNRHFHRNVSELVFDIYRSVQSHLQPDTPLFTKQLAPGLSLAEDPNNGESFGMSRCRIVAEGIWDAYTSGSQSVEARIQSVHDRFAYYHITLEAPYLNPQSPYTYRFPTDQDPL